MKLPNHMRLTGVVIAIVVVATIAVVSAWWLNRQYHMTVVSYATEVTQKITTARSALKNAQNDSNKTAEVLDGLQKSLAISKAPQTITFASNSDRNRSDKITAALNDFAGQLQAERNIIAYVAPTVAKDVQQQLINGVDQVRATFATLSRLYVADDYKGFAAEKPQLDKDIAAVRSLADSYKTIAQNEDQALAARYQTLASLITP